MAAIQTRLIGKMVLRQRLRALGSVRHPGRVWTLPQADRKTLYLCTYEGRKRRSRPPFDMGVPKLKVEIYLATTSPTFN